MNDRQRLEIVRSLRRDLTATKQGFVQWEENRTGTHWRDAMRKLARLEADLKPETTALWALLGPIQPGGRSLLDMSLTHRTSKIPLFPAIDTAWGGGGGVLVIAPEACVVDTKDTSSSPGEAVFLTGRSKIRHWVGHLDRDWPLGHRFTKGDTIGRTLPIAGQSDHAHWGVNVEALLGRGRELLWGGAPGRPARDYQLGSPTIREQLRKALA